MLLSICIPTYNRAAYIGELLDSICAQSGFDCEIEVVISDNASSDNTKDVVERFRPRIKRLVYDRAEENLGADRNYLRIVELASGDFCWLMGSDDILEPGAIATVTRHINQVPQLAGIFVDRNYYNQEMTEKLRPPAKSQDMLRDKVISSSAEEIFSMLGEHIGYISGNIVRRDLWDEVVARTDDIEQYFNAWVHVYVIGRMMQLKPVWLYVSRPCVGWRSGNDSFLAEGMYRRLEIDVAGYDKITSGLFGRNSVVYRRTMQNILKHARYRIAYAKLNGTEREFFAKAKKMMYQFYKQNPRYWAGVYPIMLVPSPLMRLVKYARNGWDLKRSPNRRTGS